VLAQDLQPSIELAPVVSERPEAVAATAPTDSGHLTFDPSQLGTLRDEIGRARADALLARFLTEADRVIAELTGRAPDDLDDTLAAIHKLAGSAAMFGTTRLYERLREFDGLGKTGRGAEVPGRLGELADIWADTRPMLVDAAPETAS